MPHRSTRRQRSPASLTPSRAVNKFLLDNGLRIKTNPAISPDYCLDFDHLVANFGGPGRPSRRPLSPPPPLNNLSATSANILTRPDVVTHPKSDFTTAQGK
jgi:hypothetical protein